MLADYFRDYIDFVSPLRITSSGIQTARISVKSSFQNFDVPPSPYTKPTFFEIFFCFSGSMILSRRNNAPVTVAKQKILLVSDVSGLASAHITAPLTGILLNIDRDSTRSTFTALQNISEGITDDLPTLRSALNMAGGCMLLPPTSWNRMIFSVLDELPPEEREDYCIIKLLELLYLLCFHSSFSENMAEQSLGDSYLTRLIAEMRTYMEEHLDEKLTIESMSRRFHISSTAFKTNFQQIYGQPVHTWLQSYRISYAARLLHTSPMTILQIAQSVGYDGVSQFNVLFKRQFGLTPRQYRKLSQTGKL